VANKKIRFTCSNLDSSGNRASITSYALIPEAATLTTMATALSAWFDAVAAVTDGNSSNPHYTVEGADAPIDGVGFDDSWSGRTGTLTFNFSTPAKAWGLSVPAWADAAITAGNVDLTNAAVVTLIDLMLGAVLGGNYTDNTWNSAGLSTLRYGFLSDRERGPGNPKVRP
jgi:hypothetical protein